MPPAKGDPVAFDDEPSSSAETSKQAAKKKLRTFTYKEVAQHSAPDDLWLVIDGEVYDATKYYPHHPGGTVMHTWAGRDASDPFRAWHKDAARKKLKAFKIGSIDASEIDARATEYAEDKRRLCEEVEKLYGQVDWFFYAHTLGFPLVMWALAVALVAYGQSFYVHTVASSLALALAWHQAAWIGHDMMHSSVFSTPTLNHGIGLLFGNLLTGVSGGWWKYTHNMHHATVNEWDKDPDITHMPLLAVTEKMFLSAEARPLTPFEDAALLVLVPLQHVLYLPIMLFARFNLYAQGIIMYATGRVATMPFQRVHFAKWLVRAEVATLVGYWLWYVALVVAHVRWHSARDAAWFVMIGHLYMGVITLSHWERPMDVPATGTEGANDTHEWYRWQTVTARNINNSAFNDWYWGGLNYQIEHHLFPRLPRHHLGRIKPLVMAFCAKHDIAYSSVNFLEAVRDVVGSLMDVAGHIDEYKRRKRSEKKQ